jgi:hypothetical protein
VRKPVCTPSKTLADDFDCTAIPVYHACTASTPGPCASPLAAARVWMQCFPYSHAGFHWSCTLVDPPPGTPIFSTSAQKAAPKHGVWECRALTEGGDKIGPFFLATSDPHAPMQQEGAGYMTLVAARALAGQLHVKLVNLC